MGDLRRTYLDHNASSPLRPKAAEAMLRALSALPGNPSSVHAEGRAARAAVETARDEVAGLVGARARDIVFTSGGTEAANALLAPGLGREGARPRDRLLIAATEHACCLAGHRFPAHAVTHLAVDGRGILDLAALEAALAGAEAPLVAVQIANNETGVLQPIADAVRLARAHGDALVVADAVQAAGRVPVDIAAPGLDALFLSAHKLGGPKGVGALALAPGVGLAPLVGGGGQELGRRGGTENVAGIVGFGVAAAEAGSHLKGEAVRLTALRDGIEARLRAATPGTEILGAGAPRLPNTLAFALPGVTAETALMAFDLDGFALSSGAACSSGKVGRSTVLAAMGLAEETVRGALRVSLGWTTSEDDVTRFLAACDRLVASHYRRNAVAA